MSGSGDGEGFRVREPRAPGMTRLGCRESPGLIRARRSLSLPLLLRRLVIGKRQIRLLPISMVPSLSVFSDSVPKRFRSFMTRADFQRWVRWQVSAGQSRYGYHKIRHRPNLAFTLIELLV